VFLFATFDPFFDFLPRESNGTFVYNTSTALPTEIGLLQAQEIDPELNVVLRIDINGQHNLLDRTGQRIILGNIHDDQGGFTITAQTIAFGFLVDLFRSTDQLPVKNLSVREKRVLLRTARLVV
jgi:hypothetical protein